MTAADEPDMQTGAMLSQMDQFQAVIAASGDAFGSMYERLIAHDVRPDVACAIVTDAAHQWFAGSFNKSPGIRLPGL